MRRSGDMNCRVVKPNHSSSLAFPDSRLKDELPNINEKNRRPKPIYPISLPALSGKEEKQSEIDCTQTTVLQHAGVKIEQRSRDRHRKNQERKANEVRMGTLKNEAQDQEQARIGN